jgi:hypothetical protein
MIRIDLREFGISCLVNRSLLCLMLLLYQICGWSAEKFDWSKVLVPPPGSNETIGNQILHFRATNKPYEQSEEAKVFVNTYLSEAVPLTSDAEALRYGSDNITFKGLIIELGVCTGKTINFIAALNPHQKIYGFDSFEGLPEDWVRGNTIIAAKTFSFKNPELLPPVLHNVELIKGWFSDTLVKFMQIVGNEENIAFLYIDSDIYSSAATAFQALGPKICHGTIIVFDELYNYPGCENHEFKAFQEFLNISGFKARYLAYNIYHEQVVVQIINGKE